jgi:hypothetical protein
LILTARDHQEIAGSPMLNIGDINPMSLTATRFWHRQRESPSTRQKGRVDSLSGSHPRNSCTWFVLGGQNCAVEKMCGMPDKNGI